MRCHNCDLVYVSLERTSPYIIQDGPVTPDQLPGIIIGTLPEVLMTSRERFNIFSHKSEYPTTKLNHLNSLKVIEKYRQPPGKILDYGCGSGHFLRTAQERGWQVFGIEPMPGHALFAKSLTQGKIINDTLRDDTFEPGFFDVITAFQVFEHLCDPKSALEKLVHILKPGGIILLEVPDFDTWSVKILKKRHRHFVHDHLVFFTPKTLRNFFERSGISVLESYHPTRNLSLRYLFGHWGKRYLNERMVNFTMRWVCRLSLQNRVVSINLGDILAMVGSKAHA